MAQPLMPKATAMWLIENTALTFEQIAGFCDLHILEVQSMADGEVNIGMVGRDPIAHGQLTQDEVDRCTADPGAELQLFEPDVPLPRPRTKGPRYTPVARRQDRPDAIAWLLKSFPELSDGQISRLVGTTKPTINSIRDRTHWNMTNIKPKDPVGLGLCGRQDLGEAVEKARRAAERAAERAAKRQAREQAKAEAEATAAAGETAAEAPAAAAAAPDPTAAGAAAQSSAPAPVRDAQAAPAAGEPVANEAAEPQPDAAATPHTPASPPAPPPGPGTATDAPAGSDAPPPDKADTPDR